jgi:hypothetical protein
VTGPDGPDPALAAGICIAGVAEPLPEGERILWRGAPRRALVARHVLHVRLFALYFALTAGWWTVRTAPMLPADRAVPLLVMQLLLGALVLGLLHTYALLTARGTTYIVTSRRLVMRVGAVFPVVVNVPLALVVLALGLWPEPLLAIAEQAAEELVAARPRP